MTTFVPLYQRVKERIRRELLVPAELSGTRLPTERELQNRYNVSRPTISKALAALAAEGLVVKSQGRGSFVLPRPSNDRHSRNVSCRPRRIGFVAPIADAPLVQRAFKGIYRAASRRDYRVLMAGSGNSPSCELASVRDLVATGANGLIIYPVPRKGDETEHDYLSAEALGVPVVLVDTCMPEQGHTQIVFDNRRAGYALTSWLIHKGHRRIGLVGYSEEVKHGPLQARRQGYLDALHDHRMVADPCLVARYPPFDGMAGLVSLLESWLVEAVPDAIIAPEDMAALETMEILRHRDIDVPDDVRVVGFDNLEAGRRYRPSFTTTNPDFERLGELAGEVLVDAIETGKLERRTYVLDVPLHVRRSVEHSRLHVLETAGR